MIFLLSGCMIHRYRPCTQGGESASRTSSTPFRGVKKCNQKKNQEGQYVNDGKYYEWYQSDKIAIEGEYTMGVKTGRWIEYDEEGKKIFDQTYSPSDQIQKAK